MSKIGVIAFVFTGWLSMMAPQTKADEWNQKTIFTFSNPVQIPGHDLMPGTYVFKIASSLSDRDIVEVFNKNETHLYGTFLTIPDYRLKPVGKTIITFSERPAGTPEAVRAWFYPGENYGHRFVYPKSRASELARANHEAVPSMSGELGTDQAALKQSSVKAQQPTGEEVEANQAFTPPPSQAAK